MTEPIKLTSDILIAGFAVGGVTVGLTIKFFDIVWRRVASLNSASFHNNSDLKTSVAVLQTHQEETDSKFQSGDQKFTSLQKQLTQLLVAVAIIMTKMDIPKEEIAKALGQQI